MGTHRREAFRQAWVVLTALPLLGGTGVFLAGQLAVQTISPAMITWLRFAGAAPFLGLWAMANRHRFRLLPREWALLAGLGLIGTVLYNLTLLAGLRMAPVTDAGLLTPVEAPIQVVLSWLLLSERPSGNERWGLLLSTAGLLLLLDAPGGGPFSLRRLGGDLLLLASMTAWPLYAVLGRRAALRNIPPLVAVTVVVYTGVLGLLPVAFRHARELLHLPIRLWAAVAYLALIGTVLSWAAYYWAVGQVGPNAAAPFANLVPVWTVAVAGPFLHRWPTLWQLVGAAAVVGGIAWGRSPARGNPANGPSAREPS